MFTPLVNCVQYRQTIHYRGQRCYTCDQDTRNHTLLVAVKVKGLKLGHISKCDRNS
jgi:hypothetical protein